MRTGRYGQSYHALHLGRVCRNALLDITCPRKETGRRNILHFEGFRLIRAPSGVRIPLSVTSRCDRASFSVSWISSSTAASRSVLIPKSVAVLASASVGLITFTGSKVLTTNPFSQSYRMIRHIHDCDWDFGQRVWYQRACCLQSVAASQIQTSNQLHCRLA